MFALKSAICLSNRLQFNAVPKLLTMCPSAITNVLVRQPKFVISHTNLNQSNNFATAAREVQGHTTTSFDRAGPIQSDEPDVLYHMIEIELRTSEPAVLKSYNEFVTLSAQCLDLKIEHCPPKKKYQVKRWIVLKSRHGHRKHMVTYEIRTYHHKIQILRLTGSTADTFLEYIQRNLPEGVSMRVGRVRMEKLPDHLLAQPSTHS